MVLLYNPAELLPAYSFIFIFKEGSGEKRNHFDTGSSGFLQVTLVRRSRRRPRPFFILLPPLLLRVDFYRRIAISNALPADSFPANASVLWPRVVQRQLFNLCLRRPCHLDGNVGLCGDNLSSMSSTPSFVASLERTRNGLMCSSLRSVCSLGKDFF